MIRKPARGYILICLLLAGSLSSASVKGQGMSGTGQVAVIRHGNLEIKVDNDLRTQISMQAPGSKPLTAGFAASEYLETKYYSARDFRLARKESRGIRDAAGAGRVYRFYGRDGRHQLEKMLFIRVYDQFLDFALYKVAYVNHGHRELTVKKWVNHQYGILAGPAVSGRMTVSGGMTISADTTSYFWSFQGSSHSDRRDWIQKIGPGFGEENYMGMNASDYGGGIPLIDLWRPDAGLAIGYTGELAATVSLPIDYDRYGNGASVHIEYAYPDTQTLAPGDTLQTAETFVSVHRKDCFPTLKTYGLYMQTKGIRPAVPEPAAFEPIWCAWGYERHFTLGQILGTLPKVKQLGIKWVGLDDGYQQAEGDWHTNKTHFPGGDSQMKAFVDSVHALGMKAALWWTPLAVDPGSQLLQKHPKIVLVRKDGSPGFITWWDAYYMSPTDSTSIAEMKATVKLFLQDWGFDALKLDGQHMNACMPDYGEGHGINRPEESFERMPQFFKALFETAREIKPEAVVEFCPCGDCINFYHMPYTNQFVASDPENSWQVRFKGKVYKALMPGTAYFGDHVELTDGKGDFASQLGVGAVPGTKFIWPATGTPSVDENFLSPEKEVLYKRYLRLYEKTRLSQGLYRGDLYDIGYDRPETHCIEKDGHTYYAFYAPAFSGTIELRGLQPDKTYRVFDYFNGVELGTIRGSAPRLAVSFRQFLLVEAVE